MNDWTRVLVAVLVMVELVVVLTAYWSCRDDEARDIDANEFHRASDALKPRPYTLGRAK